VVCNQHLAGAAAKQQQQHQQQHVLEAALSAAAFKAAEAARLPEPWRQQQDASHQMLATRSQLQETAASCRRQVSKARGPVNSCWW